MIFEAEYVIGTVHFCNSGAVKYTMLHYNGTVGFTTDNQALNR
jgi:hypothetical protein